MGWLESAASLLKREGSSDGDRAEEHKSASYEKEGGESQSSAPWQAQED
jgi:hypothetical protein